MQIVLVLETEDICSFPGANVMRMWQRRQNRSRSKEIKDFPIDLLGVFFLQELNS